MKELWTSVASVMGVFAFFQSALHALFPPDLRFAAIKLLRRFLHYFSSYCYFDITENDGVNTNELYSAVQLYLSSSASVSATRLSLSRALNSSAFTFALSNNDCLVDTFRGATATWEHVVVQRQPQSFSWRPVPDEKRGFTLRLRKRDKILVLHPYLDHIMDQAAILRRRNQDRLLYTNARGGSLDARGQPWESVPFKHPSTFDTLAMDPRRKADIMADLRDFADGKAFYHRTGRAWKRGYLLYGPPGTGKSSMIAAIANYLGYDVYDLELTEVTTNSELRKLLMKTTSKSIIVIEDIDCSLNLTNRNNHPPRKNLGDPTDFHADDGPRSITLSGLLNFTDGLWSCCGSERIFVFTTNHIDKLDPALLRSGRMDMHVQMGHCTYEALRILMRNYLGWEEGDVEGEEELLEEVVEGAEMTPADASEVLIRSRRKGKREAMRELVEVLKGRKKGAEEVEEEKRALESPKEGGRVPVEDCEGKRGEEES